jgi:hypothetical protein
MDYITIKEAAEKWGISGRAINYHIAAGRIEGAVQKGHTWLIPMSTQKPKDLRFSSNRNPKKSEDE